MYALNQNVFHVFVCLATVFFSLLRLGHGGREKRGAVSGCSSISNVRPSILLSPSVSLSDTGMAPSINDRYDRERAVSVYRRLSSAVQGVREPLCAISDVL